MRPKKPLPMVAMLFTVLTAPVFMPSVVECGTEEPKKEPPPAALVALEKELKAALKDDAPEAKIDLSQNTLGYSLTLDYKTQLFMVHSSDRAGVWAEKAHEERGPKHDGCRLRLEIARKYGGPLSLPSELNDPYWKTYVNEFAIKREKDRYIWMVFSYGSRTDEKLIVRIKKSVSEWCAVPP